MSTYCVPGIVLSAEHKAVNETESFQTFTKPKFWSRELDNEQINKWDHFQYTEGYEKHSAGWGDGVSKGL